MRASCLVREDGVRGRYAGSVRRGGFAGGSLALVVLVVGCGSNPQRLEPASPRTSSATEATASAPPATPTPPTAAAESGTPLPAETVVVQPLTSEVRFGSSGMLEHFGPAVHAVGGRALDPTGRWLLFADLGELGVIDLHSGRVGGRVFVGNTHRASAAFTATRDRAVLFGPRGWSVWDLAHDVVTTVALPGEVALDEVGGRVLHVAGSQMTLRSLDGEALTGPVETRVHPGPGPDQHIHVGLAGRRTRWVLLNDHTLEVRDATTLELVVRHEAQRDSVQLDAHPDADAFVVRTAHRVELFDARTGRRRARLTAPSRQLLPDAVVFGAGGQQVLVVWSAFFENEDEEMWWEHQLTLHDVATGRALAHTDQSYGSASGPLVFGRSARYASEEAWMRWEPGHAPAPEPHPAAQPGVTVSRDPAVNEDEVHPVVDRDGEVVAWIVERDRDRLELIAGDHRSNVDLWYSGGEVRVSDSPFANGVEWDRGTVTALSAHGATHFHQHRPNIRWTPEGRAIACPVREPPAECGVGRERAAVLRGPGGVGERSSGRVLTLRRAGHALTVQTGSAADGTRACLVVTDESGTVSDCEPGQVLARGPGHVLDAPLTNSARRGAASALVTFFTRDPGLAP